MNKKNKGHMISLFFISENKPQEKEYKIYDKFMMKNNS